MPTGIARLVDEIPAELSEDAVKRVRALLDTYAHVADLLKGPGA